MRRRRFCTIGLVIGSALLGLLTGTTRAPAESPSVRLPRAAQLFPKDCVIFVSIPDVPKLKSAFLESSAGRMLQDPQLAPFLSDFWAGLLAAGAEVEEDIGLSIPALLSLPQGELSFALVASSTQPPRFLVMLESGDQEEALRKLVDRARKAATDGGAKVIRDSVAGIEMIRIQASAAPEASDHDPDNGALFIAGGTLFIGNDIALAKAVAERVAGQGTGEILADNAKFRRLLQECRHASQGTLHFIAFADPLQLIEGIAVDQPSAAFAMALLPILGLDGLNSLGFAMSVDVAAWDSIAEFHAFLDNPRTGVLDAPAFQKGEPVPEVFVPASVIRYMPLYIDVSTTLNRVAKVVDGFRGEGTFQRAVARPLERNLGVNLMEEVLPLTAGRISLLTWFEQPVRVNSRGSALIFHVKDPAAASALIEKVADKLGDRMQRKSLGTREYFEIARRRPESLPPQARLVIPCVAVIEDSVVLTDSDALLAEMFATLENPNQGLRESLEFKLTLGKVRQLAGSNEVTLMGYARPEEGLRALYESARSPEGRDALRQAAESSPPAKALLEAMEKNELPPFDVLAKYFAPQGMLFIDDGTGWHIVSFALRKKF